MACVAPRKLLVEGFDDPFYDTSAIGPRIGYVHRSERHGLSAYDWTWIMDFVERKDLSVYILPAKNALTTDSSNLPLAFSKDK